MFYAFKQYSKCLFRELPDHEDQADPAETP